VIDLLIQRRQAQRAVVRHRVESHRVIFWRQAGSGWLGGSVADLLGGKDDVDAAGQFLHGGTSASMSRRLLCRPPARR
jgi:hypothetical protein